MSFSFWSNEDRLFVSRRIGLGWNINFEYIACRLGLIKGSPQVTGEQAPKSETTLENREDRLRKQIEASKYEEKRR